MVSDELHEVDKASRILVDIGASARCEQHSKSMNDVGISFEIGSCRIILKNYEIGKTATLLGFVTNVLPENNVEVRLDCREDTLILAFECVRPADAESAVVLARSFIESCFKASSIKFVQNLCTDYPSNQDILLRVSESLLRNGEYQEAEAPRSEHTASALLGL